MFDDGPQPGGRARPRSLPRTGGGYPPFVGDSTLPAQALGPVAAVRQAVDEHSDQYRPLGAYAGLTLAFNGLAVAGLIAAHRAGRLPDRFGPGDLALLSAGTYKLARVVAKDRVTSALRSPFTRFQSNSGFSEVEEAARGRGLQRAIGELIICPECLGQWVAAGFVAGHIAAPKTTRAVATTFSVYAAADGLQLLHAAVKQKLSD